MPDDMVDLFYFTNENARATRTYQKKVFFFTTLPETASLPSVPDFAECFLSGTRQRGCLPSARDKALGNQLTLDKEVVCRVPSTRQTITLGKTGFAECYSPDTRQRAATVNGRQPSLTLCQVPSSDTR